MKNINKDEFINEVAAIGEGVQIETNEDTYSIEEGDYFLGGEEGTFMSELLGNIAYDEIESCASAVYDYIVNELKETIIGVNI